MYTIQHRDVTCCWLFLKYKKITDCIQSTSKSEYDLIVYQSKVDINWNEYERQRSCQLEIIMKKRLISLQYTDHDKNNCGMAFLRKNKLNKRK